MNAKKLTRLVLTAFAAVAVIGCLIRAFVVPAIATGTMFGRDAAADPERARLSQAQLAPEEAAAVEAYEGPAQASSETLENRVWTTAGNGDVEVRFHRGYAVVKQGEKETVGKFVIEVASAAEGRDGYDMAVSVDGGKKMARLTKGGEDGAWELECPSLLGGAKLVTAGWAADIAVGDVDPSIAELLGGPEKMAGIKARVAEKGAVKAPKSTAATWDGKAALDYSSRTVEIVYALDGGKNAKVSVTASFGGGDVAVR